MYTRKTWLQQQILTARAFLVHSTDWLKQITTFVKFQRFQNHSAKNLEMYYTRIDFTPAC